MNVSFDASSYASTVALAGNAWRNADGKADGFARNALAAIVTDALSPLAIAISVYDEMRPLNAKGKPAEPKEGANGKVSVSTLRAAKGGPGARSALEAIFYVADHVQLDNEEVARFIRNDKGAMRLFPLAAHLGKVKAEQAKAAKDALPASEEEREGDDVPADAETVAPTTLASDIAGMTFRIANASASDIESADAELTDLLEAIRNAYQRLAASEQLTAKAA